MFQPGRQPVYAQLPLAPITASPVPELTSLYHNAEAGDYGDRSYPGNCSGNLIKDLLRFFQPAFIHLIGGKNYIATTRGTSRARRR
jgi:hypothetical protein